jgi:plasmid stabilization system protein ParE
MAKELVQTVSWSPGAKTSFHKIIEYLAVNWSQKEIESLLERTEKTIAILKCYPEMGRPSAKRKGVRIFLLDRHTQIIYCYKSARKEIVILHFWGMKQNPKKFKF